MKRKLAFILLGFLAASLLYRLVIYNHLTSRKQDESDESKYATYAFSLPKSLSFAGEKIPLEDARVRDRMVRLLIANTYSKTQTLLLHKEAARWFPLIERTLKKYGVPDDFKYLAAAESRFAHNVSSKGASGFWQFIPATAKMYGLEITSQVDERYDAEKATVAACRYIKDCNSLFDNWTLAAASYNMGPVALQKEMKKQNETSYYDLLLNRETSWYIFKVLAMKEILTKPTLYGYKFKRRELYRPIPYKAVVIDSSITNAAAFAAHLKTTLPMLRYMNPWFIGNKLTNSEHKKYTFKVVKPGFEKMTGLEMARDSILRRDSVVAVADTVAK